MRPCRKNHRRCLSFLSAVWLIGLSPLAAADQAGPVREQDAVAAYGRAAALPHPRFFEGDASGRQLLASLKKERAEGLRQLQARLRRHDGKSDLVADLARSQPSMRSDPRNSAAVVTKMNRELAVLPDYALAWLATGDPHWKKELLLRLETHAEALLHVASRNDYELVPLRNLVWAISFALDIAYTGIPEDLRRKCLESIALAMRRSQDGLIKDAAQSMPNNSRYHSLAHICAAVLLHAGSIEGDRAFLNKCLPAYLNRLSPYGGDDGGQFDGTSYTVWGAIALFFPWDVYKRVGGIDPYSLPWTSKVGEFFTYFVPPGAPTGAFGDGAEVRREEEWSRFLQQLAARVPTPLLRWAAANRPGGDNGYLGMVLMPISDKRASGFPHGVPNSRLFGSVGWVAMHSSLADRQRTSVLFKSSRFGSVGHAHADQNSLLLNVSEEPVLISSGVYDWYGSPHSLQWYRQSRAHNTVTYDNGTGQVLGKSTPASFIRDFWDDETMSAATGVASDAYEDGIEEATRTLVYIRPGIVLIRDRMRASSARTFEINFHTYRQVEPAGEKQVRLAGLDKNRDVCISVVDGPKVEQQITNGYPVKPNLENVTFRPPPETHIRFSTQAKTQVAEILSIISIGCGNHVIAMERRPEGAIRVQVDAHRLVFLRDGRVTKSRK